MATTHAEWQQWITEKAGSFTPHCLYIRAGSVADLEPDDGFDPYPAAVPVHAHEYIHHLHNISTWSGAHLFIAATWLLRSLPHATDLYGHFPSTVSLTVDQQRWATAAKRWMVALWGRMSPKFSREVVSSGASIQWKIREAREKVVTIDIALPRPEVHGVEVDLEASEGGNALSSGTIDVGYDFISEGIAYEVDREIRRHNDPRIVDLDKGVALYPYLAFRRIVDHFVGRPTTALERIDLGAYALMTSSPAAELRRMCEELRQTPRAGRDGRVPQDIAAPVIEKFNADAMSFVREVLAPELSQLGVAGVLGDGVAQLLALFRAGFALRTVNPVLESNFTGRPLGVKELYAILAGLPDACTLQEKPGGVRQLRWVGPGIVGVDTQDAHSLGALQAAMHFGQQHFASLDGTVTATDDLPNSPCPYTGVCSVERDEGNPAVCRTRPWERSRRADPTGAACWYETGVRALAKKT